MQPTAYFVNIALANLIGEGGLFGSIDFLLRRQNGNELIRDRGSCHFA